MFSKKSICMKSKVGKVMVCLQEQRNALAKGLGVEEDNR